MFSFRIVSSGELNVACVTMHGKILNSNFRPEYLASYTDHVQHKVWPDQAWLS